LTQSVERDRARDLADQGTEVKVLSLHHDISSVTGEEDQVAIRELA
jgi:hypothetical protein